MLRYVATQAIPVPTVRWLDTPHIGLQDALADRAALIGAVWACRLGQ